MSTFMLYHPCPESTSYLSDDPTTQFEFLLLYNEEDLSSDNMETCHFLCKVYATQKKSSILKIDYNEQSKAAIFQ